MTASPIPPPRQKPADTEPFCFRCHRPLTAEAYYCARCGLGVGKPRRIRRFLVWFFVLTNALSFIVGSLLCNLLI